MTCTRVYYLSDDFFRKGRNCCNDIFESGGNTVIDADNCIISEGYTTTGGYNFINLNRGLVDWHSHPRKCNYKKGECAVGVPSHLDLNNVALGALFGTQAHILFSPEGTYIIKVPDTLRNKITSHTSAFMVFSQKVNKVLLTLHNAYAKNRESYNKYRERYILNVNLLGFDIHFFPNDDRPSVTLDYSCSSPPRLESVDIPKDIADRFRSGSL